MRTMLLLAVVSICGCSTMRTVAPDDLQATLSRLQSGDSIAVRTANTWHEDLTLLGVIDGSIRAEDRSGERLTIARSEVTEIQVRTHAPGKAAGLGFLIFIVTNIGFCC